MADEKVSEDWLLIGRIVGAHGLNGHVKVFPESDFPERFIEPGERWIKKLGREPTPITLKSGRYLEGTKNYLVKLAGISDRNQAEDLRGTHILVPADDLLPLDPGEFHVSDLIGLKVVVQADETELGIITDVFTTGHDLLEVTLHKQATELDSGAAEPSDVAGEKREAIKKDSSIRAKAAEKLRRKDRRSRKKKKPKTLLIPFVEDIVPVVDIDSGRIEITPPPGLIDL